MNEDPNATPEATRMPLTVAEQITALITDVDLRIAAEREAFKLCVSANQDKMKALLAERREITAAIQGVRRRSPGKPAKARKAKAKKDVAA